MGHRLVLQLITIKLTDFGHPLGQAFEQVDQHLLRDGSHVTKRTLPWFLKCFAANLVHFAFHISPHIVNWIQLRAVGRTAAQDSHIGGVLSCQRCIPSCHICIGCLVCGIKVLLQHPAGCATRAENISVLW